MPGPKRTPVSIEQLEKVAKRLKDASDNANSALLQMKNSGRGTIYIPGLPTLLDSVLGRVESFAEAATAQAFASVPASPPEEQMAKEIVDSEVGKAKTKKPSRKRS